MRTLLVKFESYSQRYVILQLTNRRSSLLAPLLGTRSHNEKALTKYALLFIETLLFIEAGQKYEVEWEEGSDDCFFQFMLLETLFEAIPELDTSILFSPLLA